jgi:hypothetical protein
MSTHSLNATLIKHWTLHKTDRNGLLSHPQDLDAPLRLAAQRKINSCRQQYADNQNISFLPAMMTTSSRMHSEFLRLLFLQTHRETTAHFNATGLSSQQNRSDNVFRFKRDAFYMGLNSTVRLVAAKALALWINLNIQGCSVVALRVGTDSKNLFIGQYDKLFEEYWLSPISYLSPYRG